jgi:hypothetical protein
MNYPQPYLQKYKGKATRHTCPLCETKLSFTLYLNGDTHEPISPKVGKCNRESKCGYHYTPKQYFIDNPLAPSLMERAGVRSLTPHLVGCWVVSKSIEPPRPIGTIPFRFVQKSASYKSNFVRFLFEHFSDEQIRSAAEIYALGATKSKEVIFWQIDIKGKVRTGKIMQYNPVTGKRIKHEIGIINWVHNKLKKAGTLPEDFNLQQCFFGEHLLTIYPEKYIGIVESEKSAVIASCIVPDMIWLAAGNLNGLSIEKCQVLKGRDVMLYPDLGAYEKWSIKATEIQNQYECKISISTLLEDEATDTERANGLDIADFTISELRSKEHAPMIKNHFSPTLLYLSKKNIALAYLIAELELEEM